MKAAIAERIDVISYTLTAIARARRGAGQLSSRAVATKILRDFPDTILSLAQLETEIAGLALERGMRVLEADSRATRIAAVETAEAVVVELARCTDAKLRVVEAAQGIAKALPDCGMSAAEIEDDLVRLAINIGIDIDFSIPRSGTSSN